MTANAEELAGAFDAAALAELYVQQIAKSRSVGRDGVRHGAFSRRLLEECELIHRKATSQTYKFTGYREKLISRGAARYPRQISVPTIRDRLTLRAACNVLQVAFPNARTRPPHVFIKECANEMKTARGHSSFVRMDIQNFYPSIRHDLLIDKLATSSIPRFVINIIEEAIKTPTGTSANIKKEIIGVPQGLSISNILAGIYLLDFDREMQGSIFFRRYVDDVLIIAPSEEIKASYIKAYSFLANYGLTSHPLGTPGKTYEGRISEGVEYLGYTLKPGKTSVRPSSFSKMINNLLRVITNIKYNKHTRCRDLFRLNLKISGCLVNGTRRGWMMFFAQTDDKSQLKFLDKFVNQELQKIGIDRSNIKTFIKSYHEIRFNLDNTQYIPNFDKYDFPARLQFISLMTGADMVELEARSVEQIEAEFSRLVTKEVSDLEKDIIEAFS